MPNPNAYDEEGYIAGSSKLRNAVALLWDSGASKSDIETIFADACDDAEVEN